MEFITHKGEKLVYIANLDEFLDEQGRIKCDLFNSEGAILTTAGNVPREKIFEIPVYTYQDVFKEFKLLKKEEEKTEKAPSVEELPDMAEEDISGVKADTGNTDKNKINWKEVVGEEVVDAYNYAGKIVQDMMNGSPLTVKKYETTHGLIQKNLKQDWSKLFLYLTAMRDRANYTFNHCLSVSILITKALEEFREYQDRDEYWDVFKTRSYKVNFSRLSIERYAIAGLFHDFGKAMLPQEIIQKPGPLTPEELKIIRQHPMLGVKALKSVNVDDPQVLEIVGNHHAAYPALKNWGQGPLAVICNIIDIYDACRSNRAYNNAFPFDRVIKILNAEKDKYHWNSFLFNILVHETLRKFEDARNQLDSVK